MPGLSAEPARVRSLHCHPQSSTSISCSWGAPEADFDSYSIECLHQESQTLVYSRRTGRDSTSYIVTQLEPHKLYAISVKVMSDGTTSEAAEDRVVTMIDCTGGWRLTSGVLWWKVEAVLRGLFLLLSSQVHLDPLSAPGLVKSLLWLPNPPSYSSLTAAGSVTLTEPSASSLWL